MKRTLPAPNCQHLEQYALQPEKLLPSHSLGGLSFSGSTRLWPIVFHANVWKKKRSRPHGSLKASIVQSLAQCHMTCTQAHGLLPRKCDSRGGRGFRAGIGRLSIGHPGDCPLTSSREVGFFIQHSQRPSRTRMGQTDGSLFTELGTSHDLQIERQSCLSFCAAWT